MIALFIEFGMHHIKPVAFHKDVWYKLLTNKNMYKNCKNVNAFALKFLNRSLNKAVVEVEVASLNDTSTEKRPLAPKTTSQPHPLGPPY